MRRCVVAALLLVTSGAGSCVATRGARNDLGLPTCHVVGSDLLAADALQCWFAGQHGRWRTLSHESHYTVLVVNVEAADLRDANDVARQFVSHHKASFSEILVYVRDAAADTRRIRRIRWTADAGFESIDFAAGTGSS